ncbi:hypothetical protein BARVI_00200 [Barnesiella viscericola DSM 18177]|uniref:Outer membrane protein beta-barrel domain-containing protein n=1 Tax=Barnesiella viscericola DSM 18177 TaxID=880074 RepID=W0ERX8_9BACT|nr:hypothetical protein [Barnesiella viscericola]AHF13522.1 hypothetical protein BARVI_00200 [Barnesiella viscericola DSM 18177]
MIKKVLLILSVVGLLSSTGSAQILKNTWIVNPQVSGFNLGSTHTQETGNEAFDLGLKVEAGNFIANNLAFLVGLGGDFSWNKEYNDNSIDLMASIRYYTLTTLFIGVNTGYTHAWNKPKGGSSVCRDYLYVGAELGYAIFVSPNISLDPALYWKHSFTDKFDQYGLKIGLSVYF